MTITKERLLKIQHWRETYGPGSNVVLPAEEAEELARIALTSLEAEPYGYVHKEAYDAVGSCGLSNDHDAYRDSSSHIAVYNTPLAPVSVPDEVTEEDCPAFVKYDITEVDEAWARGFNACRAAMQGAEPVTTAYKLPPHIYRELVNRLHDTAAKYQGCQQLREQLSRTLQEVIQPAAPQQEAKNV